MFKICSLLALVAVVCCAPLDHDVTTSTTTHAPFVDIIESSSQYNPDGSYHFLFRGEDGSFREETAVVRNQGTEDEYLEVTGSYSFFDSNGKEVVVNYTADNHGFVPEGGNIPDSIAAAVKVTSQLMPVKEPDSGSKKTDIMHK